MSIKDLYDWAEEKGIEGYIITIGDTINRQKYNDVIFAERCDVVVDDTMHCIVI